MYVKIPKEKYLNEHIKVTLTVLITYWGVLSSNSLAFQFSSVKKKKKKLPLSFGALFLPFHRPRAHQVTCK